MHLTVHALVKRPLKPLWGEETSYCGSPGGNEYV